MSYRNRCRRPSLVQRGRLSDGFLLQSALGDCRLFLLAKQSISFSTSHWPKEMIKSTSEGYIRVTRSDDCTYRQLRCLRTGDPLGTLEFGVSICAWQIAKRGQSDRGAVERLETWPETRMKEGTYHPQLCHEGDGLVCLDHGLHLARRPLWSARSQRNSRRIPRYP